MKFRAFSPQGFGQIQKEQFIGNMYTFKFFGVVVQPARNMDFDIYSCNLK